MASQKRAALHQAVFIISPRVSKKRRGIRIKKCALHRNNASSTLISLSDILLIVIYAAIAGRLHVRCVGKNGASRPATHWAAGNRADVRPPRDVPVDKTQTENTSVYSVDSA